MLAVLAALQQLAAAGLNSVSRRRRAAVSRSVNRSAVKICPCSLCDQPLLVVNCLGAGSRAIADAMRDKRSGLAPCDFETVALDTYIGRVAGLEEARVRPDLVDYDCRNNRLAQLGIELDGFAGAVAEARDRYGAARIGVFMGTSTSGILATELAYRRRDPRTGALPPDYRYAETHNSYSLAAFVRRYLGLQGPAFVVSSACASTAKVFGNAARMIASGVCDAAVVGGVDTLCLTAVWLPFSSDVARACRPSMRNATACPSVRVRDLRLSSVWGASRERKTCCCSASGRVATPITCPRRIPRASARGLPCSARWNPQAWPPPTSIT